MPAHWIIDVAVEAVVTLPCGESVDRDAFYAWVWEAAAGLVGIDEGSVTVGEAAAQGLADAALVIDTAAAPADRDWVAGLDMAQAACWFADEDSSRAAASLLAAVLGCHVRGVRMDVPGDDDARWQNTFSPIDVPGFGVVRPAWDAGHALGTAESTTIFIEPGVGFGTGLHETTQLCLAALHAWRARGGRLDRVLDFGSGSGILGIAAAVCGARHVDAVEVDTLVHGAILANAVRNGVAERVRVWPTPPADAGPYDLVLANIVAPVLLEHADRLCGRLGRAAGCVLSGLQAVYVEAVADRYAALLDRQPHVAARGEWRCLTFTGGERPVGGPAIQ
jgi:ribosomal protein L11 methyltransferase